MNDNFEGIEFKEVARERKVRKKKHYLLRFLVFVLVVAGIAMFITSDFFALKSVEVEGGKFYSQDQIINLSQVKKDDNIFFGESVRKIPDTLMKNPYFSEVKISRKLPDKIVIKVTERKQFAAVAYGEEFVVIDPEGTVLRVSEENPKLTTLNGLTISKMTKGEKLEAEEKSALDLTIEMLKTMDSGDIFFKRIDFSKVIIKAYINDNFIVKGTPKQIIQSIEKGELQKVVNNLIRHDTTRGTISMGDHNYMSFSPNF